MNYLSTDFASRYSDKTPPWGFQDLGYVVFKRTYSRPVFEDDEIVRTEEWWETLLRVINGAQDIGADFTDPEMERLFDYMFNLKGTVAGRGLWQLGTENNTRLGADSLVNCWYVELATPEDFGWLFERLMLGGGVGFSVDRPDRLGVVRGASVEHLNASDADFIVPDKREGWSDLLVKVLRAYLGDKRDSTDFSYSTQLIRPAGAPIKTFGGVASGPEILTDGIRDICVILDGAKNRLLTSVELLDVGNIIGRIVVSGNVRRSAQIALGDPLDVEYLAAKRWDTGKVPAWRAMSNNTVYVDGGGIEKLPDEFWEGYLGNGEPYGLFNLDASQQFGRMGEPNYDPTISGTNPCAEIGLAHRESCNLAEIYLPNVDSQEEMIDLAKLLYKIQKAVAGMSYLDDTSSMITKRNMRLGLGVTGVAQAGDKLDWLSPTYEALRGFDAEWSKEKGWPQSIRLTTVKPSGTLSLLAGVTPGVHPGYAEFHIRRVRMSSNDPLVKFCEHRGYHVEPVVDFDGVEDPRTVVIAFPCAFPEGTKLAEDVSAIHQLELQSRIQREWADNAVSTTVYYKPDELEDIKEYLGKNWAEMKSVSFLLHQDHGYRQAPLEEISQEQYEAMSADVHDHGSQMSLTGYSTLLDGEECVGGMCPIR